ELIALHYPTVLRGDPNVNMVTFVLDAKGNYVASTSWYQPPEIDAAASNEARMTAGMRGRGARGSGGGDLSSNAMLDTVRARLEALSAAATALANAGGRGRGG